MFGTGTNDTSKHYSNHHHTTRSKTMSEQQNNETLCDFIREIRSQADEIAKHLGDQHTFVEQKKQLADRLDQIRMRMEIEQAKLRGNSAAMREALKRIVAASIVAKNANAPEWILQRMADIFAMATTALAATEGGSK